MYGLTNLNGGEMPHPPTYLAPEELRLGIKLVGNILSKVDDSFTGKPSFGFAIRVHQFGYESELAKDMIKLICDAELPKNVKLYQCDGKYLFDMRGPGGGVVTAKIFYLIKD